jgi:hypothetical protein
MPNEKYPYYSLNGEFFNRELLDEAWSHLHKMSVLWNAGIDSPSPTDKLAFHVLKMISAHTYSKVWNETDE